MNPHLLLIGAAAFEACAILALANKPRPDGIHALAAAGSANLLAWLTSLIANPIILTVLLKNLPREIHGMQPWVAWFCAFTIANAVELATIQWIWRITVNKSMAIAISLANAVTAASEIYQLLHR